MNQRTDDTMNPALELARLLARVVRDAQAGWKPTQDAVETGPSYARLEFTFTDGARVAVDLEHVEGGLG